MQSFHVDGQLGRSSIHVGETLRNLETYLPSGRQVVIVTDQNIQSLYRKDFPDVPVITIGAGEEVKTLDTVEMILRSLIEFGCDRSSFVVGIGGGIVCDITGFAASCFLRGVGFGFVSTSLLSQVDASVGGKNGVNLDSYKNMVGVFNQPDFVLCDIELLNTLPRSEISNGLAEIVKHGLIKDIAMLEFIEANQKKALELDYDTIFRLVADSVKIKSQVVQADEKEAGERRILNFGHTLGHAIEKIEQAGHGRAVSMGMAAAARFSKEKGYLSQQHVDRITGLLNDLDLPTDLNYDAEKIIQAAGKDKKKEGQDVHYVFLEKIGQARVDKISLDEMNQFIYSAFKPDQS